jgi:hypothetical protein
MILYTEQVEAIVNYILKPYEESLNNIGEILQKENISPDIFAKHQFSQNPNYNAETLRDNFIKLKIDSRSVNLVGCPDTLSEIRTALFKTLSTLLEPNTALMIEEFRRDAQIKKNHEIEEHNATINPFEEAPRRKQPYIHMNLGKARVDRTPKKDIERIFIHLNYNHHNNPVYDIFKHYKITHLKNQGFTVYNDGHVEVRENDQMETIRAPGEGTPVLPYWTNGRQDR